MKPVPIPKQHYEAPELIVFELTTGGCILQARRLDPPKGLFGILEFVRGSKLTSLLGYEVLKEHRKNKIRQIMDLLQPSVD